MKDDPPVAEPLSFGSQKEFETSDNPHCVTGDTACLSCLMRGGCLLAEACQDSQSKTE